MRRLAILFGVWGVVLSAGAAAWLWLSSPNQERALVRIKQLGGKVQIDETRRDQPVVEIDLEDCPVGDDDLRDFSCFIYLQFLDLTGTRVTDAGLAHLKGLTQLRELDLSKTRVTKTGLAELRKALPNAFVYRTE
jgi:Leucine Rich repeat